MNNEQIVREIMTKTISRFRQEIEGENDEFLDRTLRKFKSIVTRCAWKSAQKWSKWEDAGPVLMPDRTRIYYRKGNTEVVLQEFAPQIRLIKFKGNLVNRQSSSESISSDQASSNHHFSLALPYVIFIFKFVNGTYSEVRCAFSDRPLKNLSEVAIYPYLSNIDSELRVCLGHSFDSKTLNKNNISQQIALVLDHFWSSYYVDEWSQHYWKVKAHFQDDPRMATLQAWEEHSSQNPLFVVEDVKWMKHEKTFGDFIVTMLESDSVNVEFGQELYEQLTEDFMEEIKKTFTESLDGIESKVKDSQVEELVKLLG